MAGNQKLELSFLFRLWVDLHHFYLMFLSLFKASEESFLGLKRFVFGSGGGLKPQLNLFDPLCLAGE